MIAESSGAAVAVLGVVRARSAGASMRPLWRLGCCRGAHEGVVPECARDGTRSGVRGGLAGCMLVRRAAKGPDVPGSGVPFYVSQFRLVSEAGFGYRTKMADTIQRNKERSLAHAMFRWAERFLSMHRMKPLVVAAAVAGCWVGSSASGQSTTRTAVFEESTGLVQRVWIEYRPAGVPVSEALPTVLVLHPGLSSPGNIATASGWNAVADANRVMIVYPAATPGTTPVNGVWNAWRWTGAPIPVGTPANIANRDDLGFLVRLIELLTTRSSQPADPARVYMTGFSSGAQMADTFAGSGVSSVAAYAPVSGGWCEAYGVPTTFCRPAGPVPLWF